MERITQTQPHSKEEDEDSFIFCKEAIANIQRLGEVLRKNHAQLLSEGIDLLKSNSQEAQYESRGKRNSKNNE